MKTTIIILSMFLLIICITNAEEMSETKDSSNLFGFYASASIYRSHYKGDVAAYTNVSLGTLINEVFTIAVLFREKHDSWLINSEHTMYEYLELPMVENDLLGLQIGVSQKIHSAVNLNFGAIYAQGKATYNQEFNDSSTKGISMLNIDSKYSQIEPYLGIEFIPNISWIRLELMTSYNIIFNLSLPNHTKADLSGPSVSFAIKVGIY